MDHDDRRVYASWTVMESGLGGGGVMILIFATSGSNDFLAPVCYVAAELSYADWSIVSVTFKGGEGPISEMLQQPF